MKTIQQLYLEKLAEDPANKNFWTNRRARMQTPEMLSLRADEDAAVAGRPPPGSATPSPAAPPPATAPTPATAAAKPPAPASPQAAPTLPPTPSTAGSAPTNVAQPNIIPPAQPLGGTPAPYGAIPKPAGRQNLTGSQLNIGRKQFDTIKYLN